jgi:predicted amidophosphoribosyltransferase
MSAKCEDNFGFYVIDNDMDELEFFYFIKKTSKPKVCVRCHRNVRLLEQIQTCATCSQALEYGASSDPAWPI